jgi:membrane-associated protease RseP (regulator of RpoE activity)
MSTEQRRILIQIGLFLFTFLSATLAGAEFCFNKSIYAYSKEGFEGINPDFSWNDFWNGARFSVPFLLILTVHEFGHYFTAMHHRVKASLPYYIPLPPLPFFSSLIGTMGAVIRLRSKVISNIHHFDIGLAGPLAGFVVALAVIFYGFMNLPPADYVFSFHPEYVQYGADYAKYVYTKEYFSSHGGAMDVVIGSNLVFEFFTHFVADPERIPNPHELMHYPILLAGFIALFFTALNLLPIGQLDGGHITYGLFAEKGHSTIAASFFILLIFYSGLGLAHAVKDQGYYSVDSNVLEFSLAFSIPRFFVWIPIAVFFNYFCFKALRKSRRDVLMIALLVFAVQFVLTAILPVVEGYRGWMLFGAVIARFVGIHHPPAEIEVALDPKRVVIGWIMLLIFIVCFSPKPLMFDTILPASQ